MLCIAKHQSSREGSQLPTLKAHRHFKHVGNSADILDSR